MVLDSPHWPQETIGFVASTVPNKPQTAQRAPSRLWSSDCASLAEIEGFLLLGTGNDDEEDEEDDEEEDADGTNAEEEEDAAEEEEDADPRLLLLLLLLLDPRRRFVLLALPPPLPPPPLLLPLPLEREPALAGLHLLEVLHLAQGQIRRQRKHSQEGSSLSSSKSCDS